MPTPSKNLIASSSLSRGVSDSPVVRPGISLQPLRVPRVISIVVGQSITKYLLMGPIVRTPAPGCTPTLQDAPGTPSVAMAFATFRSRVRSRPKRGQLWPRTR